MFKITTPSKLLCISTQELSESRKNRKLKLNTEEAYTQCVS
jgi:urease gamma subunit